MGTRGQASILIAIIFQVLFVFFGMVINMGLLIHDKINLQNSVDIAAYYGAMKQAETLNTIAHLNYQIRQAWKLFAWRIWVMGSSGRNRSWQLNDGSDTEFQFPNGGPFPITCVMNPSWKENYKPNGQPFDQDLCRRPNIKIPELKPIPLTPFQALFPPFLLFEQLSKKNSKAFSDACKSAGINNYKAALDFLTSYKINIRKRRIAMQKLQELLINSPMKDITGAEVQTTVRNTFLKNLTSANRDSVESFEFVNALEKHPFLVPVEVFVTMMYQDHEKNGCSGEVKFLNEQMSVLSSEAEQVFQLGKSLYDADYGAFSGKVTDAEEFAKENPNSDKTLRSLVGFEKNPWVLAYVKVRATTRPRMLFAPTARPVQLVAEAYAMPFGGRIGPWYTNKWEPNGISSAPTAEKTDPLLPVRIGISGGSVIPQAPNYSRTPGDKLGLKSQIFQNQSIKAWMSSFANLPTVEGEYDVLRMMNPNDPMENMLISGAVSPKVRAAELAALAPDSFDALNYSINPDFGKYLALFSGGFINDNICTGKCSDYGPGNPGAPPGSSSINSQISLAKTTFPLLSWYLKAPEHINSSWSHTGPDVYSEAADVVGKAVQFGGRSGYSVKLVSKKFLSSSLPLGGKGTEGKILNPDPLFQ